MARADNFTFLKKQPIYYSDFLDSFDLNPQTGLLGTVTNTDSVTQSIYNLVLTNKFERFYQPSVGSKVQSLNFEMNDPLTSELLQQTITSTITSFEPRVLNLQVTVVPTPDDNYISITIVYNLRNISQPISFTVLFPRVR